MLGCQAFCICWCSSAQLPRRRCCNTKVWMYKLILFIRKHRDCWLGDDRAAQLLKKEILSVKDWMQKLTQFMLLIQAFCICFMKWLIQQISWDLLHLLVQLLKEVCESKFHLHKLIYSIPRQQAFCICWSDSATPGEEEMLEYNSLGV